MNVGNKKLHKLSSHSKFIEKSNKRLENAEKKYVHYQNKLDHLYDEKKPNMLQKVHNQLHKPYEVQYHITRSVDSKGKTTYKQGFKIVESSGNLHNQRGILHKVDDFRRTRLKSDVSGLKIIPHVAIHSAPVRAVQSTARFAAHSKPVKYVANTSFGSKVSDYGSKAASTVRNTAEKAADTKAYQYANKTLRNAGSFTYKVASIGAEGAFRTGLAAETVALHLKDYTTSRSKAALDSQVRQNAQGDGDKAGVLIVSNTTAASKALVQHFKDKHHYAPLQKKLKKQIRLNTKREKTSKRLIKSQNKLFKKNAVLSDRFKKKTGRTLKKSDKINYVFTKKEKLKLLSKVDKSYKPDLKIEKINGKLKKLQNRKDKTQLKLYKHRNFSLAHKGAAAMTAKLTSSLKNAAMRSGAADNDAFLAVDKISTIGRRQLKRFNDKEKKLNKRLKKDTKREKVFHKKSAKQKKKALKKKKSSINAKKVYQKEAAKKAKQAVAKAVFSKIGLIILAVLGPILVLPLLFTSCMGIFANPQNFGFVSVYYSANEDDLTYSSNYYQKLAYDLNDFVLSVPSEWKRNTDKLNIPSGYEDDPVNFVFGNSGTLPSDTTYDYNKHKLYAYLCALMFSKDDDGATKKWKYNDKTQEAIKKLFDAEYEFKSTYVNGSHWEEKNSYETFGYYHYGGCYWDGTYGYVEIDYPDSLPISGVTAENRLYFSIDNGEIRNANNGYAPTGWYLQDQYIDIYDNNGNKYSGWYVDEGKECSYGIIDDSGVLTIPFPYVVYTQNYVNLIHKYDRVNECSLYYTVNRKKSFDDCIRDSLMSLEGGDSLYKYYLSLSPDTDNSYYGLHQTGVSPVHSGYREMLQNGSILHGYGWEMKGWNVAHCDYCRNYGEHGGISIIQNSGSDVFAMNNCVIEDVGDNYIQLKGLEKDRGIYVQPVTIYVNVDTAGLSIGQVFTKGSIITHTNNRRQEMKYKHTTGMRNTGFVDLIDSDCGYDYLNVTIYNNMSALRSVTDPEILIALSNNE